MGVFVEDAMLGKWRVVERVFSGVQQGLGVEVVMILESSRE